MAGINFINENEYSKPLKLNKMENKELKQKKELAEILSKKIDQAVNHPENDTVSMLEVIQEVCEELIWKEMGNEYKPVSDIESFNK